MLEGSKGFVKDLCDANGIPTARYGRFRDAAAAKAFAVTLGLPVVIKADGLAAGKGVIIAETQTTAAAAIDDILGGAFGTAGIGSRDRGISRRRGSEFLRAERRPPCFAADRRAGSQARLRRR